MKNWLTAIVVAIIVANIFLYWDQTIVLLAWVVALAGWVPHLFENKGETHGNS